MSGYHLSVGLLESKDLSPPLASRFSTATILVNCIAIMRVFEEENETH